MPARLRPWSPNESCAPYARTFRPFWQTVSECESCGSIRGRRCTGSMKQPPGHRGTEDHVASSLTHISVGAFLKGATASRPRTAPARTLRSSASGEDRHTPRPHVLSEELFDDMLVRERRKADRFEETFVLFLLAIQGPRGREGWKPLVDALSQAAQDTDVIGWFRQGAVLGLVRPINAADATEEASSLAVKIRRTLGRRSATDGLQGCSMHWEVYSPS